MRVFIVKSLERQKNINNIDLFMSIVIGQLEKYGVDLVNVNPSNCAINRKRVNRESLIIICNEHKHQNNIVSFLEKAINEHAEIWPVAFDKKSRSPADVISKMQSYDVYEQLRCRNLDEVHIPSIAMSFSRKIISRVFPTLYNECGEIFISHRRLDGEKIAAQIYDKIKIQAKLAKPFRDVIRVNVGDEAQQVIDEAMKNSEVFVFVHTNKAAKSNWVMKELRFALLRNIPILWIQIDNPDIMQLKIKPSEKPHLQFQSKDFTDDTSLIKIVDEILQKSFELIMANSNKIFDYVDAIENLFSSKVILQNVNKMIYHISMERKGYHYPQRNIEQCFQIFGRTPTEEDVINLKETIHGFKGDSIIILSNKVIHSSKKQDIIIDSIEDFYYHWSTYIKGKKGVTKMNKNEIIISGAFPDCDEIYKQSLTDALIIFAKAIIKGGYILTFGAHPTFQELFFEISKMIDTENSNDMLKMFISNWFMEENSGKEKYYNNNCQLIRIEKKKNLNDSLSAMRKKMIQRNKVKALVCLGGKIKENKNEEGIREEIKLAIEYNVPVFIVGSVGGCSAEIAVEFKNHDWKNLNNASKEVNEEFLNSIDYFKLAQNMLRSI